MQITKIFNSTIFSLQTKVSDTVRFEQYNITKNRWNCFFNNGKTLVHVFQGTAAECERYFLEEYESNLILMSRSRC